MEVFITRSSVFDKNFKRLAKRYPSMKADLVNLVEEFHQNPEQGVLLGRKLRKVRMSITSKAKGKSGGARIITYTFNVSEQGVLEIRFLDIYDKSERSTMIESELNDLVEKCGL